MNLVYNTSGKKSFAQFLKGLLFLLLLFGVTLSSAQSDSINTDSAAIYKQKTRWGFGLTPNKHTKKINGLGIGLATTIGSDITINGINIELLGFGFIAPVGITRIPFDDVDSIEKVYFGNYRQKINGITASLFGHYYNGQINGTVASFGINHINTVNSLCFGAWGIQY